MAHRRLIPVVGGRRRLWPASQAPRIVGDVPCGMLTLAFVRTERGSHMTAAASPSLRFSYSAALQKRTKAVVARIERDDDAHSPHSCVVEHCQRANPSRVGLLLPASARASEVQLRGSNRRPSLVSLEPCTSYRRWSAESWRAQTHTSAARRGRAHPPPDGELSRGAAPPNKGMKLAVITRHGRPAGVLVGCGTEEDWFDYRPAHHPDFVRRIRKASSPWQKPYSGHPAGGFVCAWPQRV